MIKWADRMYFSEDLKHTKKIKAMKSIEKGELTFEVYCITFASNSYNLFDIINANELIFPYYAKKDTYIFGLAGSKGQAKLLVKDMLMEIYNKTGDFRVREFF
ncbi:hypothetical protein [Anaerocolumna sp. MB42-C2]|uniref:hypothetical protein n=1 Tax=Anaerocolumna sp. MB42-C2 TaxID=3070997 RepID=UPI0027E12026|nr:hypothetical protein [Anaerocolumna sp. MB42-C2]WMJ87909.1 hypothetical protein RBU59_28445 [Anaerocolumna sp. MB42-C2]